MISLTQGTFILAVDLDLFLDLNRPRILLLLALWTDAAGPGPAAALPLPPAILSLLILDVSGFRVLCERVRRVVVGKHRTAQNHVVDPAQTQTPRSRRDTYIQREDLQPTNQSMQSPALVHA